jgi:phosphoribosylglycinamide formyltransferase-1
MTERRRRLAILLSGRGSNFEAIADAIESGRIPDAQIVVVISDVAAARGLTRARDRGLPSYLVERERFKSRADHEAEILRILDETRPELVCLAGYMRILSPEFVARWRGRLLNIHPSLLPKYRGLSPQKRALEAGEAETGCTVHLVDEGTDTGPTVLQRKVRIEPGDTEESLSARILVQEHEAYPEAITVLLSRLGEG